MSSNVLNYTKVLCKTRHCLNLAVKSIWEKQPISLLSRSNHSIMVEEVEVFNQVKEEDIPKVLNVLKADWPKHFLLHQILTVLDEYKKAGTKWKHTLYLYGDFESGVYLNQLRIELPERDKIFCHIYTLNSDLEPLRRALKQTTCVPWQEKLSFQMGQHRFTDSIVETFTSKYVDCRVLSDTMFWYPPTKKVETQSLPEDIYLDFLDGSYSEVMNNNWPHRFPGSDLIHKEHLEKNFGLGLFKKADKRLVCSALSNYTGGIFVLYSDPEFRGRGLAKTLVQQMVLELRRRGRIPFCTVILGNTASEQVFSKSGFEAFCNTDYVFPK